MATVHKQESLGVLEYVTSCVVWLRLRFAQGGMQKPNAAEISMLTCHPSLPNPIMSQHLKPVVEPMASKEHHYHHHLHLSTWHPENALIARADCPSHVGLHQTGQGFWKLLSEPLHHSDKLIRLSQSFIGRKCFKNRCDVRWDANLTCRRIEQKKLSTWHLAVIRSKMK